MANLNHVGTYVRDPLQGFDIRVSVSAMSDVQGFGNTADSLDRNDTDSKTSPVLEGSFTGFMCRLVNQTEAYLPLNQRIPRMLDGEIMTVWSLEQGMVQEHLIANVFGGDFARAYAHGRHGNAGQNEAVAIPRSRRVRILLETNVADSLAKSNRTIPEISEAVFSREDKAGTNVKDVSFQLALNFSRVDTASYGVVAGRRVASCSWQGTAQTLAYAAVA